MGKWLAAGGLVVLVLVLLLWREMRPTDARATPATKRDQPAVAAASPRGIRALAAGPAGSIPSVTEPLAAEDTTPAKLDPKLDEVFYKFEETIPKVLTQNAATCYEGRHGPLRRNQKLSLRYKVQIVQGEVKVRNVTVKESTLNDAALETCLIQAVQRSTWKDDQLRDSGIHDEIDDEIVLRPERGMKKFWQDNLDDVGAEAPRQ